MRLPAALRLHEAVAATHRPERRKVFSEMKTEISDIAIEIAEKVTEKEIDSDKHRELIDSFIDQIGEAS